MQGPQLCAKPRHFCKLDVATSRMAFQTLTYPTIYMFYKLPLHIQTIEGALVQNCISDTPQYLILTTDGAIVAAVSVLDEEDVQGLGDLMFYLTIYLLHNCIENDLKIP